jgi:hypothetical protein
MVGASKDKPDFMFSLSSASQMEIHQAADRLNFTRNSLLVPFFVPAGKQTSSAGS